MFPSRMPWLIIASAVLIATGHQSASTLYAQPKDDRPRLFLNAGGPFGNTNFLAFSPDSQFLLAAGLDKVAHCWNVQAPERPRLVRTLRWEFARGFLGAIQTGALARTPDGLQLAVAGLSARNWDGDIVILDVATGNVVRVLPSKREQMPQRGHRASVISLDWSPRGTQLLSVDETGEVRLWSAPNWTSRVLASGRELPANDRLLDRFAPAMFLSESRAVLSLPDAGTDWRLQLIDVRTGREIGRMGQRGRVTALTRIPDPPNKQGAGNDGEFRWASADASGLVYVWRGAGFKNPQVLRDFDLPFATGLQLDRLGQLAVATSLQDGRSGVELWDINTAERIDQTKSSTGEHTLAVSLSADGRFLATHRAQTNDVLLFPLRNADGEPIAQPLSKPPVRLGSRGQGVCRVAFSTEKNYRLAFGQTRNLQARPGLLETYGPLERAFNLHAPDVLPRVPDVRWRALNADAGNWRAEANDSLTVIRLLNGNIERGEIRLDPQKQGQARCFTWIAGPKGQPAAVAIGTNIQHGIYVYSLPGNNQPSRLLRYFRDHQGAVLSLSVSHDGRYLASGSDDQTMKIWSLLGLFPQANFPHAAGWGADFQQKADGVHVLSVVDSGIAQRRGLQVGDVIQTTYVRRNGKDILLSTPGEVYQSLVDQPLTQKLVLKGVRMGKPFNWIVIVPAWEPLLTLFVDRQNEWALWTPEGYYDSSVGNGSDLFGWQINRGAGFTPRILKAEELQETFERPDILRALLSAGSIPAAFRQLNQPVPENLNTQVAAVAAKVPEVSILKPRIDDELPAGQVATLTANVRIPSGRVANDFTIRAYVNGIPMREVDRRPEAENTLALEWEAEPPDRFNRFKVIVEENNGNANSLMKTAEVAVGADVDSKQYRVHILAIAANNYQGNLQPLKYAVPDAQSVLEMIRAREGDFYTLGEVRPLLNEQVTKENVESTLQQIRANLQNASSRDLLVIYLAGHGYAFGPEYFYIPPDAGDFTRDTLEVAGISWWKLKALADVPCRKVVLLDTCRSGNVLLQQDAAANKPRRSHLKAAVGPLKRADFLVITATGTDEDALEAARFDGHGVFTWALLKALRGQADGVELPPDGGNSPDGIVALRETIHYVQAEVEQASNFTQFPQFTPGDLFELSELPLVRAQQDDQP